MTDALRVLLIEDSPSDAKLVIQELGKMGRPVEFDRVETLEGMRVALEQRTWDIVISDWSMPRFSAPAALALLKESRVDIPFIIVSGTVGEELAVDAMRAGANDYVLKDKLKRLAPAVERELRERENRHARRQAELGRREAEQRLQRMIESAMVGIWAFDDAGNTTFMNAHMARILGMELDEALRTPVADFIGADLRPVLAERLAQRKTGAPGAYEQPFRRKGGSVGWMAVESSPLHDVGGRFEGVLAIVTDVTERRRAEAEQRESEARFSHLAGSGIIGVVQGDLAGNVLDANDAFLKMVGYSREEMAAGSVRWQDLTAPEWQAVTERGVRELRATAVATPYEKEYVRKDGSRVPVLVGIAMLDESRSIAFMVDLTAQKRAEEAFRKSEEQLRQAQKMEAVGRLAGGVAHDFNNLLSVILSYSSMIAGDLRQTDPMRDDVLEIEKAGKRATDLTRQLLMFSRQEVVEPRILDLNTLLADMDKMLQRILGEDVDLVSQRGPALGRVRVDPSHIEQVIMNLVVNSRDAMPTGGRLTIETKNVVLGETHAREHLGVTPGPYVMLAVSDTGMGIDRATQARMFEPFFTTKEKGKGTGLGLSTVFGIVQQCGGSIWVYSEPGKGTSFKVYIPQVDADAEVPTVSLAPTKLTGSETILLVEDEDQIRLVAREILRKQGYEVIEARNAGEALLLCEGHPGTIDLLLTDVVMPRMSGPELAKRLVEVRPGVKVLCMSGYTDDAVVRHGALAAGVAYLQKPITPDSLARKVRAVLDAH